MLMRPDFSSKLQADICNFFTWVSSGLFKWTMSKRDCFVYVLRICFFLRLSISPNIQFLQSKMEESSIITQFPSSFSTPTNYNHIQASTV